MPVVDPCNSSDETCQFFQWAGMPWLRRMRPTPQRRSAVDFNVLAHDLRAPLNVMLVQMRLIAVEALSDSGRKRIGVLEEQVHRMLRLLDTYAGREPYVMSPAPVDVGVMLRNVVSELEALIERRGIEITLTTAGSLPRVPGDRDLLHRVLLNLLTNAVEAMSKAGAIVIATRTERAANSSGGTLRIDVADSGAGMTPEIIAHAFEHGFTTKGVTEIRGFGLGICREIVQMHGGQIQLSSVPGQGTTVSLMLPIHRELRPSGTMAHDGDSLPATPPERCHH
jgi:signal transduction histidine kinase